MATRRHPHLPLIRLLQYGVTLMQLPEDHDQYLKNIESSARRNIKKSTAQWVYLQAYQFQ